MTAEEKAKAYDEALERARKINSGKDVDVEAGTTTCEYIFPELKESEDERIRKWLFNYVGNCPNENFEFYGGVGKKAVLSWIEKQKEVGKAIEAVEEIDKYLDEHLANAHDMKDSNPDKKYYRGWDDALGKIAGILQDVYSEEKKKEQNECSEYCVRSHCIDCSIYEKKKESLRDFIDNFPYSAEKEERDYRKLCEDIDQSGWFRKEYIDKCIDEEFEQKGQKPVEWSEEDEKKRNLLIDILEVNHPNGYFKVNPANTLNMEAIHVEELIDWLKSLRPQSKVEWSEEDRDRVAQYLHDRDGGMLWSKATEITSDILDILHPQPKQEWSEDDEKDTTHIIRILDDCYVYGKHDLSKTDHENLVNKLKSLSPQQKVEWSDDDEGYYNAFMCEVVNEKMNPTIEQVKWLRGIRDRLKSLCSQPQMGIYQSAKHDLAIKFMNYLDENRTEGKVSLSNGECEDIDKAFKENNWAKIIGYAKKYQIQQEQKPVEWSEEDERMLEQVIDVVYDYCPDPAAKYKLKDWLTQRLKSIHPQPHTVSIKDATKFGNLEYERGVKDGIQHAKNHQWKPSEEQMKALKIARSFVVDDFSENPTLSEILKALYEQLKKLM